MAALIHTTPPTPKPECWSGEGRLSGWLRDKAKCTGRDCKAREHLSGTQPPSQASPTKSQSKPPGSGQKWPSCQPCSAKGRAAEPSEEPVGHLPCNAVCLFRCFPSCSRPLIPPRLCSCTARVRTVHRRGTPQILKRSIQSCWKGQASLPSEHSRQRPGVWSQTLSWACADSKHWTSVTAASPSPESLCALL